MRNPKQTLATGVGPQKISGKLAAAGRQMLNATESEMQPSEVPPAVSPGSIQYQQQLENVRGAMVNPLTECGPSGIMREYTSEHPAGRDMHDVNLVPPQGPGMAPNDSPSTGNVELPPASTHDAPSQE